MDGTGTSSGGDLRDIQLIKNDKVTDEKLQYLKNIYQKCKWYYWLHTKTYYYIYKIYIGLHILMTLINTVTAILNTITWGDETYNKSIRYISATILLMNTFLTSVLNLLKIDRKLEYHKNMASDYISLSVEIEEYIMIGEEIETTIRIYKTYLSYSTDNDFIVPERIIKSAEKTLKNKYASGKSSSIGELISEIKQENSGIQVDFNSPENTKIKQLLATKPISASKYGVGIEDDSQSSHSPIEGKFKNRKKKPVLCLNIDNIETPVQSNSSK